MECPFIIAQDGHHWTQQFGESSMFLGSSVIGGVSDLGAVYYNPGRITQLEGQVFVFSGNAYEINTLKINDLLGDSGYSTQKFKGVPTITAGTFNLKFMKKSSFAWAVLVMNDTDLDINLKSESHDDVFPDIEGEEYFSSSLNTINKLRNTWSCLTWSYPVNKRLGVGITAVYSHISKNKNSSIDMAALAENTGSTAVYNYQKGYDFTFDGLLCKLGMAYKYNNGIIGLTVLTPVVKILGSGSYSTKIYTAGLSEFKNQSDVYGYNEQSDIDAFYRSPWAIGFGMSYKYKRNTFHFGLEWYSRVGSYTVLNPEDYEIQSSGEQKSYIVVDEQNSILNYGLGFEVYFSEKVQSYFSFGTDYCSLKKKEGGSDVAVLSLLNDDYFNIGGGVKLNFKATSISLGLAHTGAKSSIYRPLEIPSDLFNDDDITDNTSLKWNRWRVMFSMSVPLWKNIQEKINL